jgi:hypothetical protein
MVFVMVGAAATAVTIAIFLVAVMTFAMTATFAFVAFFTALAFMVLSVMATAAAVVFKRLEVFFGSFANGDNFNGEVEVLASEFVVGIDDRGLFANGLDADRHRAIRSLGIEHHACFDVINTLENVQRNFLGHTFVVFTVAFSRDNDNVKLVANIVTDHSLFEARDDHVHALDVLERFATCGRIDDGTFVRLQGVVHLDDCFFCNFHKYPLESRANPRLNLEAQM